MDLKKSFSIIVVSVLSLLLLFNGCDSNKIEVVPYYDEIYSYRNEIDPQLLLDQNEFSDLIETELSKELMHHNFGAGFHQFKYRFYLSEDGVIEKLVINKGLGKELDKKIIKLFEQLEFKPAINNNTSVSSQIEFKIFLSLDDSLKVKYPYRYSLNQIERIEDSKRIYGNRFADSLQNKLQDYSLLVSDIPQPVGGLRGIQRNILYPVYSLKDSVEGIVLITAFINEVGEVDKTMILRGINFELDNTAMQLVRSTNFKPARLQNEYVKSKLIIPVEFNIERYKRD